MAADSKIEWTDDSANFWWGCTRYGEGCRFCYAERLSKRVGDFWGPTKPRYFIEGAVASLRALNRKARKAGKPRLVFLNSMSDWAEEHTGPIVNRDGVQMLVCDTCGAIHRDDDAALSESCETPDCGRFKQRMEYATLADLRRLMFRTIDECPSLVFILLTKRPENIRTMWPSNRVPMGPREYRRCLDGDGHVDYRFNVWLLTSIATQADADRNIELLLRCDDLAPVLGVSAEPLLGPVDLSDWIPDLDWVIVGCESAGPRVGRLGEFAFESDWWAGCESIVNQCLAAGVAPFVKQGPVNGLVSHDMTGWPGPLRVRQFPQQSEVAHAPHAD